MTQKMSGATLRHDFEQWKKNLHLNGFEPIEVECEECNGKGETECSHCHQGEVECEECEGHGTVTFPALIDYERLRSTEDKLLRMWKNGEAAKTETFNDKREFPILPHFLAEGDPQIGPDHVANMPKIQLRIQL